jgi:hypothetical protein
VAANALIVAEWWNPPHANHAVWTTRMVMSSHPHTTFQKGLERVAGRGAGILLGTLIVSLFGDAKFLALGLEVAGLLAFFHAHFCGRLAYTYQNAGLYLQAMLQLEFLDPLNPTVRSSYDQGRAFFFQRTGDPADSRQMTWQALADLRHQQASSMAYFDVFWLFAVPAVALVLAGPAHEALGGREGPAHRRGVAP